jgi:hypothetical protein
MSLDHVVNCFANAKECKDQLDNIKTILEAIAYLFGALFLFSKLIYGQANAGMDVSLDLKRFKARVDTDPDQLSITLKLKRSDVGRIRIDDITLDIIDFSNAESSQCGIRSPEVMLERKVSRNGQIQSAQLSNGLYLPPNDGTQLGYWACVTRGCAIRVDVTITSTRTGLWFGHPQWRASAISLPEIDKVAAA